MRFAPPAPFNTVIGIMWLALLVFGLMYLNNNVAFINTRTMKRGK